MKRFREYLFTYRSYTPLPFLFAMIVYARPTTVTMLTGILFVLIGEALRFWGVAYAGSLTRVTGSVGAPEVIVAGPFAHVRNPLYVGNIITYSGIGIMSNALFPWLTLGATFWFAFQYYEIVLLEEEFLSKEFGEVYEIYRRNVPRFFFSLKKFSHPSQEHQPPRWQEALRSERRTLQALGLVLFLLILLWLLQ